MLFTKKKSCNISKNNCHIWSQRTGKMVNQYGV